MIWGTDQQMHSWDETIKYLLVDSFWQCVEKRELKGMGERFHCLWKKHTWQVCHIFSTGMKEIDIKIKVSDFEIVFKNYIP